MMVLLLLLLQSFLWRLNRVDLQTVKTVCTGSACYTSHLQNKNTTFQGAQKYCKDNGGNLVTLKTNEEASEIQSVLSRITEGHLDHNFEMWIGLKLEKGHCVLTDEVLKGYTWVSGAVDSQYSNWQQEPQGTCTEERCVAMHYTLHPSQPNRLEWIDRSCRDETGYVCKFNFKGMCKVLRLAGPGEVLYTTPFFTNQISKDNAFLSQIPHGTLATVSCKDSSHAQAVCKEMNGFFGWTSHGPFCDSDKQGCKFENGGCNHKCTDNVNGGVRCECKEGYSLAEDKATCIQIDHCQRSPCEFRCEQTFESFRCICPEGFQLTENQRNCSDIDECSSNPCDHLCINKHGNFSCICRNGFEMVDGRCQDINECDTSQCSQGCINMQGSFSCYCITGFHLSEDKRSCNDIDECVNSPCEERCVNSQGSYKCSCKEHYKIAPDGNTCIPDTTPVPTPEPTDDRSKNVQNPTVQYSVESATVTAVDPRLSSEHSFTTESTEKAKTSIRTEVRITSTAMIKEYNHSKVPRKPDEQDTVEGDRANTWVLASVMGSVAAVLFLIAVASSIVLCRRKCDRKADKNDSPATDKYHWMSSGKDTPTENLQQHKDDAEADIKHNTDVV
nr:PREDICTED: complement component C1q receptor-like [Lepisosteus oculatus]